MCLVLYNCIPMPWAWKLYGDVGLMLRYANSVHGPRGRGSAVQE